MTRSPRPRGTTPCRSCFRLAWKPPRTLTTCGWNSTGPAGWISPSSKGPRRLFTAELELLDKKEDRVSACQKNLERCTMVKELAETRNKAGLGGAAEVADAEYDRLDAAILLEREKAR